MPHTMHTMLTAQPSRSSINHSNAAFCTVSCDQVKGCSVCCMQREWMVACAQSSVFVIGCAQGEPTAVVQCCKRLFEHNATALVQHQGMIVNGKDSLPQLSRLIV